MDEWKKHCPMDEDEWPVQRQAFRGGWEYRVQHGPGLDEEAAGPISVRVVEEYGAGVLSAWMQGYSAADNHLREH
jgi:hypothetical protein